MYTGIVAGICQIVAIEDGEEIRSFTIDLSGFDEGLQIGASVALDGVCMTVVSLDGTKIRFDAIPETLKRTTLGDLNVDDWVNVERSLKLGDELGGHILSGHVMLTVQVLEKSERGEGIDLLIENLDEVRPYILEKGFIGIDGMSLTVGEVTENSFELHIIPETLRVTTIGRKEIGHRVNLEIDSRTQAVVDTIRQMGVEQ
ncbi:MAG: riboflavin synthase subunit alpha [Euryarchaeota archaeon]|jgi:riboflavin synthase|nr:riboflavin synthase subunit alpha [Euryarchaeota archaeon]MBT3653414.1 riboflavin synthase subunit alpha [Euryarchaeota archaeon]MBT3758282.1 riboflavin synthase subunit alpha [Euryarchaeota archaeon]MBT4051391.1 riboflavin synthase subunit alpha [Euryarchaeota archaeon]MBT4345983.1 riboflavin synthase subunit alpha [Euryarchaeota archaeon]|tara:strand:+ start:207 stop:809 length:603 start_codon:yes stop_codon:yes gene_type:complete